MFRQILAFNAGRGLDLKSLLPATLCIIIIIK
jgi:hypothetical protein